MNFSLRFLLTVLFLLPGLASVSAHALGPFPEQLHDLSKESTYNNLRGSTEILEGFEVWAKEQEACGVYSWLGRNMYLNGSPRKPLELVQGNAYAVRWFLERAFDGRELNSENTRLMELLDNTLQAIPFGRRNVIINRLLETSFGMHGSTWLAEVLFNRLTNESYWENVAIDYPALFRRALQSRNYRLIAGFLLVSPHFTAAEASNNHYGSYREWMLMELASSRFFWEQEPGAGGGPEFEWDYLHLGGSNPTVNDEGANAATEDNEGAFGNESSESPVQDPFGTLGGSNSTVNDEGANAATEDNEGACGNESCESPVQDPFGIFQAWLASSVDRSGLAEAMNRAVSRNNEPAIAWLESLGIPRPNIVENYEYQNQPRAENDSLVRIIDDEPENPPSRIWSCFGCFSR